MEDHGTPTIEPLTWPYSETPSVDLTESQKWIKLTTVIAVWNSHILTMPPTCQEDDDIELIDISRISPAGRDMIIAHGDLERPNSLDNGPDFGNNYAGLNEYDLTIIDW